MVGLCERPVNAARVGAPAMTEPDPSRWKALAVCLAAGFMTLLDVSIVDTAPPSVEQGLGAEPDELQWIVSGSALTLGSLLVASGRVGDARGRRPVFVADVPVGIGPARPVRRVHLVSFIEQRTSHSPLRLALFPEPVVNLQLGCPAGSAITGSVFCSEPDAVTKTSDAQREMHA